MAKMVRGGGAPLVLGLRCLLRQLAHFPEDFHFISETKSQFLSNRLAYFLNSPMTHSKYYTR